ncbi:MAG TPA: hypothetical protein VK081_14995, partial [Planctomycetota bacterium]|nr:hypothetical protein [Planctomycetota bacterium]
SMVQRGAQASFEGGDLLAWAGPWLFAAIVAVAVLRALARGRSYRAAAQLSPEDREAVREALRAVERRTVGEVVAMVVDRSDVHDSAGWRGAVLAALLGSILLAPHLPWHEPMWVLFVQVAIGAAGLFTCRALPDLERRFVLETTATAAAEEQALQEFFRLHLHETSGRTGVLLFVSLFERRVVVLGDVGIDALVRDKGAWSAARDAVLAGIRAGRLREGLIAGIAAAGDVLAEHFPWREGDKNELRDLLIVDPG